MVGPFPLITNWFCVDGLGLNKNHVAALAKEYSARHITAMLLREEFYSCYIWFEYHWIISVSKGTHKAFYDKMGKTVQTWNVLIAAWCQSKGLTCKSYATAMRSGGHCSSASHRSASLCAVIVFNWSIHSLLYINVVLVWNSTLRLF